MIELIDVCKRFGDRQVLDHMSLKVDAGETYVLMGPSGSGKSVTIQHIIGIHRPDSGSVLVDGNSVPELDRAGLMAMRKRMGYLFQNGALINWLTVLENVCLPLREHSDLRRREIEERAMERLELVGMAHAAKDYPAQISGGMKLRTGLARALVTDPQVVLYDEPNAGLDPIISDQIHKLIVEVRDRLGVTGVVVTHSRACAVTVADRIGVLEKGRIAAEGTVAEMVAAESALVRGFLGGGAD
ncbi:MAG: ATP-binding cassette domain-containing protein [Planctomycetes bacterium]|nr:ATP-binding cassette domain-containing protein [Planctomycetota bacterium]MCB9889749.1 ATP-binding cassette domain-containing protein [Planctomycetota bacterium]